MKERVRQEFLARAKRVERYVRSVCFGSNLGGTNSVDKSIGIERVCPNDDCIDTFEHGIDLCIPDCRN